MWIKKSSEELRKDQNKDSYATKRIREALSLFAFTSFFFTFFLGWVGYGVKGRLFVNSYEEIIRRLPIGIVAGVILGVLYYIFGGKSGTQAEPTLICPKCEKVKEWDGMLPCKCGGHFEDIQTMKWVTPSEPSQK